MAILRIKSSMSTCIELRAKIANLLPGESAINRYIEQNEWPLEEGWQGPAARESLVTSVRRLKKLYEQNRVPLEVFLQSDATAIDIRLKHIPGTNKVAGFNTHTVGVQSFNDAAGLQRILDIPAEEYALQAYIYVAVSPFVIDATAVTIGFFATNNKFTTTDVLNDWKVLREVFSGEGFTVLGQGSDGDSRLLKAMIQTQLFVFKVKDGDITFVDHRNVDFSKVLSSHKLFPVFFQFFFRQKVVLGFFLHFSPSPTPFFPLAIARCSRNSGC